MALNKALDQINRVLAEAINNSKDQTNFEAFKNFRGYRSDECG